jgi:hypothetical protein
MGKFNYLLGNGKEVTIGNDVYTIKQLTARHMAVFMGSDSEKQEEMIYKIVTASLQQTDETITLDDVYELPLSVFQTLSEVVIDVNGLGDAKAK